MLRRFLRDLGEFLCALDCDREAAAFKPRLESKPKNISAMQEKAAASRPQSKAVFAVVNSDAPGLV